MRRISFLKTLIVFVLLSIETLFTVVNSTSIIPKLYLPTRNTPSGNTNWTITNAAINNATIDYWKMLSGSSLESPQMDFSSFTSIQVALILQSFGTITSHSDDIKVEYWDGTTWTQVGANLHTTGTSGTQTISLPFTYSLAKIKITAPNSTSGAGARVMSVDITGTPLTSCTLYTLAFASPTTISTTIGDAAFTKTATSLNLTTAISYGSDNSAVASVNATTGEITIGTAGTAKITATQAAGTHSGTDYCAATAEYTINVASAAPTITITEVNVPAMTAYANDPVDDTEIINVGGTNLTASLILTIDGTDATMFSVTSPILASGGQATITYNPTAPGSHIAILHINSTGATEVTRTLTGTSTWKPLTKPEIQPPSSVNAHGFTANWDAVTDATEYQLDVYTKMGVSATDLFISEYIEGSSNNKAIEIYNGTGATVDLSSYSIKKQTNGAGVYTSEQVLSGLLTNGSVYIAANTSANSSILALANSNNNSTITFNGNDAVALFKNGVQIDEVGVFNQTTDWGKDITLIRKSSVMSPKSTYDVADWDTFATDYFTNLGSHTSSASLVTTPVTGSPFTITSPLISKEITGLSFATQYYYKVIAKNANVSSVVSEEMTVSTGPFTNTGIGNTSDKIDIRVISNKLMFYCPENQQLEIYNAIGQRLYNGKSIEGLNAITLSAKGVLLVKVGDLIVKVIK